MITSELPVGLDRLEVFATGLDHPEGIAVTPDGELYVGGEAGQIYHIDEDGGVQEVASTGGFNLGLASDASGRLYVCDSAARVVWRVDPRGTGREVFAAGGTGRPLLCPNWGCFDGDGNYYFTDSGEWGAAVGAVWVVRPGAGARVWTEESKAFPNGCAMAPDGSRLFVVESYPSALVEVPVRADGSAGPRRVLQELGSMVPDGVAVVEGGAVAISCYRPDAILTWSEQEGLKVVASDPRGTLLAAPTNLVFTGEDQGTLVVPNLGRWHLTRGRLGLKGAPLFYPTRSQLRS